MKTGTLTKALIVIASLLTVSIIGSVAVGQIQKGKTPVTSGEVTDTKTVSNVPTDTDVNQPSQTSEKQNDPPSTPSNSSDKTVNPPTTEQNPSSSKDKTTDPPKTDPVQKAPANFKYNKTISSNTGAYINTKAIINGTRNDDGTVHLKITLNLVHYSIYTGGCANSYIKIGDNISTFTAPSINQSEEKKTETLLTTFEVDVIYGQTLNFSTLYNFHGPYGKVQIDGVKSEATLTIK